MEKSEIPQLKKSSLRYLGIFAQRDEDFESKENILGSKFFADENRLIVLMGDLKKFPTLSHRVNLRFIHQKSILNFINGLACYGFAEEDLTKILACFDTDRQRAMSYLNAFLLDAIGERTVVFNSTTSFDSRSADFFDDSDALLGERQENNFFITSALMDEKNKFPFSLDARFFLEPFDQSTNPASLIQSNVYHRVQAPSKRERSVGLSMRNGGRESGSNLWVQIWKAAYELRLHGIRPSVSY